jgi:hypothetical protein
MPKAFATLSVVLVLPACGFSFPSASTVIDQRILGIEATPPQLTGGAPATVPVAALIVDPTTSNPVAFTVRLCLVPGGSTGVSVSSGTQGRPASGGFGGLTSIVGGGGGGNQETLANTSTLNRCPDDTPLLTSVSESLGTVNFNIDLPAQYLALLAQASGTRPDAGSPPADGGAMNADAGPNEADGGSATDGGTAPSGLFEIPDGGLAELLSGVPVEIEIDLRTVNDDGGTQYGVKAIPITPVLPPGDTANNNPQLQGVTFDGQAWQDGTPLQIPYAACTPPKGGRLGGSSQSTCQHTVVPVYDPTQSEVFHNLEADGGWQPERERLTFSWFTTQGTFSKNTTGQAVAGEATPDIGSNGTYNEPSSEPSGPVLLWFVIRDGRGGESWITRQLIFD